MSWKAFKRYIEQKGPLDESKFILGIDIGNSMSAASYFDSMTGEAEIIDMSGGYGKPSYPSAIQYIPESQEWIFGEYALLNKGFFEDVSVSHFIDQLGKNHYLDIGGRSVPFSQVFGKYLKELADYCKNINPNAEIAGLVCSVPAYMNQNALEEYKKAVLAAGLDKQFITFLSDAECIFTQHYHQSKQEKNEYTLLVDYGFGTIKGGVYQLTEETDAQVSLKTLSYFEDESLGLKNLDQDVQDYLTGIYCAQKEMDSKSLTLQEKNQLEVFSYQNRNLVLREEAGNTKIYYNFTFPPFLKEITPEERRELIQPYKERFNRFIEKILDNAISGKLSAGKIGSVICIGGGFENDWAKQGIESLFNPAIIHFHKNTQSLLSQGAALYAAKILGAANTQKVSITDYIKVKDDFGIYIRQSGNTTFYPFIQKDGFWWQHEGSKIFTLNESTETPPVIEFYRRDKSGDSMKCFEMELEGLPLRPKGVTRLNLSLYFERFGLLRANVKDFGFGEIFPASGYEKKATYLVADMETEVKA